VRGDERDKKIQRHGDKKFVVKTQQNRTEQNTHHTTPQYSTGRLLTCSADMMGMRKLISHRGGAAGSDDSNAWEGEKKGK
jgi:hypothetical protein